jgi:hypothetical protein
MASHALEQLAILEQSQNLQILELSNGISSADDPSYSESRTSDASNVSDKASTTPASLAADLVHYKELFSKLRFSYLEQATKEKFLRAITAETPLFVEPSDNAALEAQLAAEKTALQAQKAQLAALTDEVQAKGRDLAKRTTPPSLTR